MSNRKVDYFKVKELKELLTDCDYLMLLSQRSDGKSYATKSLVLRNAFLSIKDNICIEQIAYIRRFALDCKDSLCEPYFSDMPIQELTDGLYTTISIYRKKIYFGHFDDNGKVIRDICIGQCFALSSAEHYKSLMFPYIYYCIYEEVISEKNEYLYKEPFAFQHLISTILRDREGKVILIGNTLSRICPYYMEWCLVGVEQLEHGHSNIYNIDNTVIKVHRLRLIKHDGKMFFGQAKKNITDGEYTTEIQPHLIGKLSDYKIKYTCVLVKDNFMFLLRFLKKDKYYTWYVEPKTTPIKDDKTRVISDKWGNNVYWTLGFLPFTANEQRLFNMLLKEQRVVYSDNLTGTEFNNIIKYF